MRTSFRPLILFVIVVLAVTATLIMQTTPESRAIGLLQATTQATFGSVTGGSAPQNDPTQASASTATAIPTLTPTLATTLTPTPKPLPTLKSDMMGIQIYANIEEERWFGLVDRASFMGFKWIKIQLSWKELEPAKGQFTQQFAVISKGIGYAGGRGFKILLSIAKAPDWARPANVQGQQDGPPANPQDLIDFLNQMFATFPVQHIKAIEIWNEANLLREWNGAPQDGVSYMRLFNAAYTRIRQQSGDIVVITAGPAPTGGGNGSMEDRSWLQAIYNAGAADGSLALNKNDPNLVIGVHPYGWANPPDAHCCEKSPGVTGWFEHRSFYFLDNLTDYREIMIKNGQQGGKMWTTEFGWATFEGLHYRDHIKGPAAMPPPVDTHGWANMITEQQQAEYIIRAFELAQNGDMATYMGPMFLWNMNWSSLEGHVEADKPSDPAAGFSVLDSDWNTRPIYNMLQSAPKQ
jgi:hypothetical protein